MSHGVSVVWLCHASRYEHSKSTVIGGSLHLQSSHDMHAPTMLCFIQSKHSMPTCQVSCLCVYNSCAIGLLCSQARLAGLTTEFNSTAQSANRLLGSLMNRGRGTTSGTVSPEVPRGQPKSASESPPKSSRRSDVPPSLQKRSNLPASFQKAQKQQEELTAAATAAADSSRDQTKVPRASRGLPQSSRVDPEQARPVKRKLSRKTEKQEEPPETTQGKNISYQRRNFCSCCVVL